MNRARYGPAGCAALLDRICELAATVPLSLDLVLFFEGQLATLREQLGPEAWSRAEARHRARKALLARLAPLRELARSAAEAQMQDPGAPARLLELLRLDPGRALSLRNHYTVHAQFIPGGFDAQALAFEVDPLGTLADNSAEADRLTRADGAVVGEVVHVGALLDWQRAHPDLPLRRDDDIRRGLGVIHALELGKPVDAADRLGALDAAERLARRRPMTLAAWLLLGRLRLEAGDPRGALEPLTLALRLPDAFEDTPPHRLIGPLVHLAQAHGALRAWEASCAALEAAARHGFRNTAYLRRQRWFRDGPRGPVVRPVEDLLRRIDAGSVR